MMATAGDRDIEARGITFHCRIDGAPGAPWITFSNSLATDLHMWDAQVEALGAKHQLLRYDFRGHGGTRVTPPPYDLALLVADLIGLWDALGVEKSHYVGLSIGGAMGIELTTAYPDRVLSAAICDARCRSTEMHLDGWARRIEAVDAGGMEAIVDEFTGGWFTPAADASIVEKIAAMIRATPLDGFRGGVAAVAGVDHEARLGDIQCPALFLAGTEDVGDFPKQAVDMHEAVPGSSLVLLERAAHLCNMERSGAFNEALLGVLASQ
jgi:3-oxoadipate enol-lactonase